MTFLANKPESKLDQANRFEVFFDGDCPLCRREIDLIRRKDKRNQLILTNIADPDFQPQDRTLKQLMKEIHGRHANGDYVVGVDVFREIYHRLGFAKTVWLTRLPLVRSAFTAGYFLFSRVRFRSAMRRLERQSSSAEQFSCSDSEERCQRLSV